MEKPWLVYATVLRSGGSGCLRQADKHSAIKSKTRASVSEMNFFISNAPCVFIDFSIAQDEGKSKQRLVEHVHYTLYIDNCQ